MPAPRCGAIPFSLWQDTARKSPNKVRAHFQLAFAYFDQGRITILPLPNFRRLPSGNLPRLDLLLDWGLAYDGLNQPDKALEKLRQAAAMEPTAHVYTQIGYIYAKRSQWTEAMQAFNTAEKLDPKLAITYMYTRAGVPGDQSGRSRRRRIRARAGT